MHDENLKTDMLDIIPHWGLALDFIMRGRIIVKTIWHICRQEKIYVLGKLAR